MLLCICDFNRCVSTRSFKIRGIAEGNKELITLITETLCSIISMYLWDTNRPRFDEDDVEQSRKKI